MPQVADPIPLSIQLSAGETNRFVRARIYAGGVELSGSPVALSHVATGLYETDSFLMPDELSVTAQYRVYTDAGFTTLDSNYGIISEIFEKTVLAVAPPAEVAVDIIGRLNDADSAVVEPISIIQGSDKSIVVRLVSKLTGDPYNLTGVDLIRACFVKTDGTSLYRFYLSLTGDTTASDDLITNIDTANIAEGMPISGTGIPSGSTVLKTPTSTSSPTAANTIQISEDATATATGVALEIGDISIVSPAILGKIRIDLHEEDTDLLESGEEKGFEVKVVKDGVTSYVQFPASLTVVERLC